MIDVYLFVAAVVAGVAWLPWAAARRMRPRRATDLDALQRAHERGYRRRLLLRLLAPILLLYFLVRAATAPTGISSPRLFYPVTFGVIGTTLALSTLAATVWRYRWDRAFIVQNPEFAGSLQPLSLRLIGPSMILVAFGLLALSAASKDEVAVFGFLGAAFVVVLGGQWLLLSALVRSRVALPLDSPFGRVAAETVTRFGFTPKRVILVPTTIANAGAFPDGTVMVTTALRAIATDEEIAAVLAHELSHVRDRDARRIRLGAFAIWLLSMLVAGSASYVAMLLPGGEPFTIAVVILAVTVLLGLRPGARPVSPTDGIQVRPRHVRGRPGPPTRKRADEYPPLRGAAPTMGWDRAAADDPSVTRRSLGRVGVERKPPLSGGGGQGGGESRMRSGRDKTPKL